MWTIFTVAYRRESNFAAFPISLLGARNSPPFFKLNPATFTLTNNHDQSKVVEEVKFHMNYVFGCPGAFA